MSRSGYALNDYQESLACAKRDHKGSGVTTTAVERVVAAWGTEISGYEDWEGGFLVVLKDGRFAYITGWNDTSGWGCQDGGSVTIFDTQPELQALSEGEWDLDPVDLNNWHAAGCPEGR